MNRGVVIAAACLTDAICGDPAGMPHPVRTMGRAIVVGERVARRFTRGDAVRELVVGSALATGIVVGSWGAAILALALATRAGSRSRALCEVGLAWTTLASRDLLAQSSTVIAALEAGDVTVARTRLAAIVGRDTAQLDSSDIARATIETLAESACDGIVAPLCALAAGGVPAGFAFKAISTLDSMIGHIEPPYTWFGRGAARLDDAACWLPARITAAAIVLLAPLVGGNPRAAWRTWRRDARRHRSPNAGRPEAAMAGALNVRLGGTNRYDGVPVHGAVLGARFARPTAADARRAQRLVVLLTVLCGAVAAFTGSLHDGD